MTRLPKWYREEADFVPWCAQISARDLDKMFDDTLPLPFPSQPDILWCSYIDWSRTTAFRLWAIKQLCQRHHPNTNLAKIIFANLRNI